MTIQEKLIIDKYGFLEKFNCDYEDIKIAGILYLQGFSYRDELTEDLYNRVFDTLCIFHPQPIQNIFECFKRNIKRIDDYLFEIEIKKAAGTYKEWLEKITKEEKETQEILELFFKKWNAKCLKANLNQPQINN